MKFEFLDKLQDKRLILTVKRNSNVKEIAIVQVSELEYRAFDVQCPHSGGPLHLGDIEDIGGVLSVVCPWHEFKFSLDSGKGQSPCENYSTSVYNITRVGSTFDVQIDDTFQFVETRLIDGNYFYHFNDKI